MRTSPAWRPPHLVTRREGGQLLDLGGLVVAAPPTQQHLAAHPLLRLRGRAGAGSAAHHVVQVLQVLGGDGLVVVAVLGAGGGGRESAGEPSPADGRADAPSGATPDERWQISLHAAAGAFLPKRLHVEPPECSLPPTPPTCTLRAGRLGLCVPSSRSRARWHGRAGRSWPSTARGEPADAWSDARQARGFGARTSRLRTPSLHL